VRSALLAAALRFVHRASVLEGVHRIALIGSLASEKPFPKDVDLLTTISDDVDLSELARLGRQLSGTAQTINSGADVFLSDPEHCYLGRTCAWRECGPGRRVRCGAEYLSGRLFLRDDLATVRLPRAVIETPPVELWPTARTLRAVPADVEQLLLQPLRA
jgi:predicted nucleotidyltransferase